MCDMTHVTMYMCDMTHVTMRNTPTNASYHTYMTHSDLARDMRHATHMRQCRTYEYVTSY